jgi:spore germination protein PC
MHSGIYATHLCYTKPRYPGRRTLMEGDFPYPPTCRSCEKNTKKMAGKLSRYKERVRRYREKNKKLKEELAKNRIIRVEKIEYKIHELHVPTLSGILNIGMTANGEEATMGEILEKIVSQAEQKGKEPAPLPKEDKGGETAT